MKPKTLPEPIPEIAPVSNPIPEPVTILEPTEIESPKALPKPLVNIIKTPKSVVVPVPHKPLLEHFDESSAAISDYSIKNLIGSKFKRGKLSKQEENRKVKGKHQNEIPETPKSDPPSSSQVAQEYSINAWMTFPCIIIHYCVSIRVNLINF